MYERERKPDPTFTPIPKPARIEDSAEPAPPMNIDRLLANLGSYQPGPLVVPLDLDGPSADTATDEKATNATLRPLLRLWIEHIDRAAMMIPMTQSRADRDAIRDISSLLYDLNSDPIARAFNESASRMRLPVPLDLNPLVDALKRLEDVVSHAKAKYHEEFYLSGTQGAVTTALKFFGNNLNHAPGTSAGPAPASVPAVVESLVPVVWIELRALSSAFDGGSGVLADHAMEPIREHLLGLAGATRELSNAERKRLRPELTRLARAIKHVQQTKGPRHESVDWSTVLHAVDNIQQILQ